MTKEEARSYIIRHCNPDYPKGKTEWERAINMAIKALEQPERKTGIWIHVHPLQSDDHGAYMCSECRTGNWEIDPESYFFCPYCGADMRER